MDSTITSKSGLLSGNPDLTACDREPIHIPGSIQPHGALLVLDEDTFRVVQAAVGDEGLRDAFGHPIGRTFGELFPNALAEHNLERRATQGVTTHLGLTEIHNNLYHLIAHRSTGRLIVELERTGKDESLYFDQIYPHVRSFLDASPAAQGIKEISLLAAREIRRICGWDRVLVYRFDDDWNGEVIAEDRSDRLPSYLDLRFPASDIPAQARKLYRLNRIRLIADAGYTPVLIEPANDPDTAAPVDLTYSVLRSVSPVHLEYMRNMGTSASMSISLLRDNKLWGLVSCHNSEPARVAYHIRLACDFIGQALSMQVASKEASLLADRRNELRRVQTRLLASMAAGNHYFDGLLSNADDLLHLTDSAGAAIAVGGNIHLIGETPSDNAVGEIVLWLAAQKREDLFVTDFLASHMPGAEAFKDTASGLLAMSISQLHDSFVLWFRPEIIKTLSWGGDPTKRAELDPSGKRLHPRQSFESWEETVKLKSAQWHIAEIEAANELRTAVVDVVLRNAEELAALSERLKASNRELEAFSYSISHDLRAPFRHIVGYAQLLKKQEGERLSDKGRRFLETIVESGISAGKLVDDLLSFSQLGRVAIVPITVDMNKLVGELRRDFEGETTERAIEWQVSDLAPARADPSMIRLVVQNLIDNALKFSRKKDMAEITIGCKPGAEFQTYWVRDNGVGFDMTYVGKLFGVFQRLHRVEEFEGTGIGLAHVKRIIERHKGRVWAESQPDYGATLYFTLPRP